MLVKRENMTKCSNYSFSETMHEALVKVSLNPHDKKLSINSVLNAVHTHSEICFLYSSKNLVDPAVFHLHLLFMSPI